MFGATVGATLVVMALAGGCAPASAQELKTADLGSCPLESGSTLEPCRVGYRTLGALSADRDNVVLAPTWFGGTSDAGVGLTAAVVDTTAFFVVIVDALGNGVSTSPSNSPTQGGAGFPGISIADMVATQYRLVTEVLGLDRLHAVTGWSMGGMQTFEWMVRYPDFVERALPLIGSPRLGAYDVALWETQLRILDWYEACRCEGAAETLAGVELLTQTSPQAVDARAEADDVEASLKSAAERIRGRAEGWHHDMASQLEAMIAHDVSRDFGGDLVAAAAAARAELLSVVVATDHVVTPWAAIEFTQLAGGESIVVDQGCGHVGGPGCFGPDVMERVRAFLLRGRVPEG